MKIFRGPHSTEDWSITDNKVPSDYIENWEPRKKIILDGTIDKTGDRHTYIGIELDEDDVISLFNSLVNNLRVNNDNTLRAISEIRELVFTLSSFYPHEPLLDDYHAHMTKDELYDIIVKIRKIICG